MIVDSLWFIVKGQRTNSYCSLLVIKIPIRRLLKQWSLELLNAYWLVALETWPTVIKFWDFGLYMLKFQIAAISLGIIASL